MYEDIFIIFIIAFLIVVIVPIITLIFIGKMKQRQRHTDYKLDQVLRELSKIDAKLKTQDGVQSRVGKAVKEVSTNQLSASIATDEATATTSQEYPAEEQFDMPPAIPTTVKPALADGVNLPIGGVANQLSSGKTSAELKQPESTPQKEAAYAKPTLPPKQGSGIKELFENISRLLNRLFGGNLLAKIGIITLVLGVGLFVKYAIDQDWINEVGRVGIGLLAGALIIGVGHKLKDEFNVFSSILVGGGLAIFYVTITLGFREYAIFSQNIAFVLLVMITIFSVFLSLLYDRQELAIFSLIGGFIAPILVSTGDNNYIVLFSYILILNTGMLVLSFRKHWKVISILSYIFTVLFFTSWIIEESTNMILEKAIFAKLFFLEFYVLVVVKHLREDHKLTRYQISLLISNNLMAVLATQLILVGDYAYLKGLSVLILSLFNFAVMGVLYSRMERQKVTISNNFIYLLLGIVLSLVSLAIPIQMNGVTITIFWAIEAVLLLWLWKKTEIPVVKVSHIIMAALSLISLYMDYDAFYSVSTEELVLINPLCLTGLMVIAALALYRWLLPNLPNSAIALTYKRFKLSWGNVKLVTNLALALLIFVVPMLEINKQLYFHYYNFINPWFRYSMLLCYASVYVGVGAYLFRNRLSKVGIYGLYIVATLLILMTYRVFGNFGLYTYLEPTFTRGLHAWHIFVFLGLMGVFYTIYQNIRTFKTLKMVYLTGLLVLFVAISSIELVQLVLLMGGNLNNYVELYSGTISFGYPILWAAIALIVLVWGIRKDLVVHRKIALIFFGLIILKFYIIDVWNMSQTGRIISFIALGLILLIGSFMQQKIKTWVANSADDVVTDKNIDTDKEING